MTAIFCSCTTTAFCLSLSEELIKAGHIMEVEGGVICMSCGKEKKLLNKMRIHLTVHGVGRPYPCPFCDLEISLETNLRRHIIRVHKKCLSTKQIRELPPFRGDFTVDD